MKKCSRTGARRGTSVSPSPGAGYVVYSPVPKMDHEQLWCMRVLAGALAEGRLLTMRRRVTDRLSPPASWQRDRLRYVHNEAVSDVSYAQRGKAGLNSWGRAASLLG